jgi:tRNA pseudouridine38-40 synthase
LRAQDKTTVREVSRLDVVPEGDEIVVEVVGDAFLKNMVRIITGTLVSAGRSDLSPDDIAALRDAHDRTRAGMTAPAHGLVLVEVLYPPVAL